MVILRILMIPHMEKESKEFSLETLPILIEHLQKMLTDTKVLELHGEMGAGKTTLIIELLKKMGVNDPEGSPTYSLINEYTLDKDTKIYHIDAFRINSSEEAYELGLDELFEENAFFFVEWAEKIINFLPEHRIRLTITTNASLTRTYSITHDHGS
jgi:tRNA threonylcarbamoyladenosine biosynthesis protein TsaE